MHRWGKKKKKKKRGRRGKRCLGAGKCTVGREKGEKCWKSRREETGSLDGSAMGIQRGMGARKEAVPWSKSVSKRHRPTAYVTRSGRQEATGVKEIRRFKKRRPLEGR